MSRRKTVSTPILIAFAILLTIITATGGYSIWAVTRLARLSDHVGETLGTLNALALDTVTASGRAGEALETFAATHDMDRLDTALDWIDVAESNLRAIVEGGETRQGETVATDDETLGALVATADDTLYDFRLAVENRLAAEFDEFGPTSDSARDIRGQIAELDTALARLIVPREAGVMASPQTKAFLEAARQALANAERTLFDQLLVLEPGGDPAPALHAFAEAGKTLRKVSYSFGAPPIDDELALFSQIAEDADWIATTHVETVAHRAELRLQYDAAFSALIEATEAISARVRVMRSAGVVQVASLEHATIVALSTGATVVLAVVALLYTMIRFRLVRRLVSLARVLTELGAQGDDVRLPHWTSEDELGVLRDRVVEFKDSLDARARLEAEARRGFEALSEKEREARDAADNLALRKREADETAAQILARQRIREKMAASLEDLVARVSAGDLDATLSEDWEDAQLARLAAGVNGLVTRIGEVFLAANTAMAAIAEADLRAGNREEFSGAFGAFQEAITATAERLAAVIRDIAHSGEAVSDRATELTRIANDLARENTAQANTVTDLATAVEQISAGVDANATAAHHARQEADRAASEAAAGQDQVGRTISAVRRIADSSAEIVAFVNAIEEIAFQTNLLALNASVEAARAGPAGKGFSVVASEVRALSQKTTDAADQIKALINRSEAHVGEGVSLVENTGAQIAVIRDAIGELKGRIETVDQASAEQAGAVRNVATSIGRIEAAVRSGAEMANSCDSAAQSLSGEARALNELVAAFRLPDSAPGEMSADADWEAMGRSAKRASA